MNKDDFGAMTVIFYAEGCISLDDVLRCIHRLKGGK